MSTDTVMIHVRFASDGTVAEIGERPSKLSPQQWFNLLCESEPDKYQVLAGGRGIFRIAKDKMEALRTQTPTSNAA